MHIILLTFLLNLKLIHSIEGYKHPYKPRNQLEVEIKTGLCNLASINRFTITNQYAHGNLFVTMLLMSY